MKKSRFTKEQIAFALRQADGVWTHNDMAKAGASGSSGGSSSSGGSNLNQTSSGSGSDNQK